MNYALSERTLGGDGELLSVEGATTSAAADRIRKRLAEMTGRRTAMVIVDLSRVSFVDSSVVQALADAAAAAKKRGSRLLVVEPVDPMVARPLEMGRLDLVAEVLPTLDQAAKAMDMAPGSLQPALPAPAPPPESASKPRRALFGRRATDQQILQELGQLRRLAQELRRETGMYQQLSAEEIERRRAAEADLLAAREAEARADAEANGDGTAVADELAQARAQLDEIRARAEAARGEVAEARAEADRMEIEAEAAHARIQQLEREAKAAHARIQQLEDEAKAARTEAERMEAEAEEAHARVQRLEAENAELRAALEQARANEAMTAADAEVRAASEDDERRLRAAEAEAARVHEQEEARRREAEEAQRQAEEARIAAAREAREAADREAREEADREARAAADREARAAADREAADRDARARAEREAANREAEQRATREAEEARRRAEEEAARKPRPRVPVWADPTPIDINTADIDELMLLPGIGRRPAERIIERRESAGPFARVDDLYSIAEIPRDRITKIRPYIRV